MGDRILRFVGAGPVGRIVLGGVWVFHIFYFLFGVKTLRPEKAAELPD